MTVRTDMLTRAHLNTARAIAAEVPCCACGNTRLPSNPPTVAVFVRGGLVQDICFDGSVRVVVLDFDVDNASDARGVYIDPTDGKAFYVNASTWHKGDGLVQETDDMYVREAVRVVTDPYAPFRDNEEERARIERELEEGSE